MTPQNELFEWLSKGNLPAWVAVMLVVIWALKDRVLELLSFFFLDAEARAAREDAKISRQGGLLRELVDEYLKKNAALLRENGSLASNLKSVEELLRQSLDREAACEARCTRLEKRIEALEIGSKK